MRNELYHYGKGHDDNPPGRGSGRYPYGSKSNSSAGRAGRNANGKEGGTSSGSSTRKKLPMENFWIRFIARQVLPKEIYYALLTSDVVMAWADIGKQEYDKHKREKEAK